MYPQQPNQQPQDYPPVPPQNGAAPSYPQQPQTQPQHAQPVYQQPYQQQPQQPTQQSSPWGQQPQAPYTPVQAPDGMASIDYLNQISAPRKRKLALSRFQIFIIGIILILVTVIVAILSILNTGGPSLAVQSQHIVAHTASLVDTTKKSQKNIKSRDLSVANTSLTLQLTSAQSSLTELLSKQGLNVTKLDKEIVAAESNKVLLGKLNDAHLSGTFDRVYSREMSFELQEMLITLKKFYDASSSMETKEQFETIYNNIEPFQKQLEEFSGATS